MKIHIIACFACFALILNACAETEYEIDNLIPEKYRTILYFLDEGEKDVTLYRTGSDTEYDLILVKAGSRPTAETSVNLRVMSQDEVDARFSSLYGVPYYVIPSTSFSIEPAHLDFSSDNQYKFSSVKIIPEEVEKYMGSLTASDNAQIVLPIIAESPKDSVNSSKSYIMYNIKDVVLPKVGFKDAEVFVKTFEYANLSDVEEDITVNMAMDNKWAFSGKIVMDNSFIQKYNEKNGTSFVEFPAGICSFGEGASFTPDTPESFIHLSAKLSQLNPGKYMLPLKISSISGMPFSIDEDRSTYVYAISIVAPQLDRSTWTWVASSGFASGNGSIECVYDGNVSTYWHTYYDSGGIDLAPFTVTIDFHKELTIYSVSMQQRPGPAANMHTKEGWFQVSDDGINWIKVGTFLMQQTASAQTFDVEPVKAKYFQVYISSSWKRAANLSEIYLYGL